MSKANSELSSRYGITWKKSPLQVLISQRRQKKYFTFFFAGLFMAFMMLFLALTISISIDGVMSMCLSGIFFILYGFVSAVESKERRIGYTIFLFGALIVLIRFLYGV